MSSVQLDTQWTRALGRRLLGWFDRHARPLPWRESRDPYRIWVSEIMLQQTQVATVIPYFQRFTAVFPHVHALAAASEEQVLRLWEGLGYYRRARQLHRAARALVEVHQGEFPRELTAIQELPGIGRYTAGAILSIAFDARHPILEANTVRLYSRLLALTGDPSRADSKRQLWDFAGAILPRTRVGDFNQALMELGATLCTPRSPDCDHCPLADLCPTRRHGLQDRIPAPARRVVYEPVREACVVVWKGPHILLRRCGDRERWAGLWDFPRFAFGADSPAACGPQLAANVQQLTGVTVTPGEKLATIKHGVTRFRITLECFHGRW
ncbi:MAG: A/G-specific adenine glycosylase, partial [Pirellulaceae bacterium]